MTRDDFAVAAMQGILSSGTFLDAPESCARRAYEHADAMLAEHWRSSGASCGCGHDSGSHDWSALARGRQPPRCNAPNCACAAFHQQERPRPAPTSVPGGGPTA